MAIYHLSIKIISRGKGKSAVAASAYRSGEKIKNEYDGIVHDFTRKGGIAHTEILLPQNAPQEFVNRSVLWNSVEKIEKSKNSQLAREIEIALPKELDREKQIELVREYVKENFVKVGMCIGFSSLTHQFSDLVHHPIHAAVSQHKSSTSNQMQVHPNAFHLSCPIRRADVFSFDDFQLV